MFANKYRSIRNIRELCKLTGSGLKQCVNIKRLAETPCQLAYNLFLFGALGGFLEQADIVNSQTCLVGNFSIAQKEAHARVHDQPLLRERRDREREPEDLQLYHGSLASDATGASTLPRYSTLPGSK